MVAVHRLVFHVLWILPLVAVCLGGLSIAEGRLESIKVVMDDTYPPYSFKDSEGKQQGILIDQWRLWERKTGIKAEIHSMAWGKALNAMKAGEFDVIDTIFKTEDRAEWLDYTQPYANLEVPIFFDKDISGITDAASLKGFPVAAKTGDAAVDLLKSNGVDNLLLFDSYEAILRAAKERKVSVFVVDAPPAYYFLYKFGIRDHYKQSAPLNVGQFHRAVRKGNNELLKIIEGGFAQIPAEELKRIETKWYGMMSHNGRMLRSFLIVAGSLALLLFVLAAWNRALRKQVAARTAELKASVEAVRATNELFSLFMRHSPIYAYIKEVTPTRSRVLQASGNFHQMIGFRGNNIVGKTMEELFPAEFAAKITADDWSVVANGAVLKLDEDLNGRNYTTIKFPIMLGDRTLLAGYTIDITERKQAEEALRESEGRLSDIMFSMADWVWEVDANGVYTYSSKKGFDLFGPSREDVIGKTLFDFMPPAEAKRVAAIFSRIMAYKAPIKDFENWNIAKSGERICFLTNGAPILDIEGNLKGYRGVDKDITERKRAEEEKAKLEAQLQQAHKMESVGRLAGGVAHDFNNMLGVILGHVELAIEQVDPAQPIHADLEEIRKAAQRSADLTRQLLAFARKQTVAPKVLDLNETVAGMIKMLQRLIGEDIHLHWQPGADLWPVKVDPSQIDQILANLCVNARDAITGVGEIAIETGNSAFDEDYCARHADSVPGDYVRLAVSDTGRGMNRETLAHIFEPFFTTKGVGQGTGLGLATVYGAAKQNNGFIDAHSEPGHGSTFTIYLPRHVGKSGNARAESAPGPILRGEETILLVEDEPAILNLTAVLLEKQGYTVLAASTPGEAIRLAQEHAGEIHVLMTDVVMPEMNGRDLAKNLLSLYPRLKRLFMSGYTADVIAHQGVLEDGVHFIQKPFSTEDLAGKIREVLEDE